MWKLYWTILFLQIVCSYKLPEEFQDVGVFIVSSDGGEFSYHPPTPETTTTPTSTTTTRTTTTGTTTEMTTTVVVVTTAIRETSVEEVSMGLTTVVATTAATRRITSTSETQIEKVIFKDVYTV